MPEETKPVERVTKNVLAVNFAYNAGWDAALERAAQILKEHSTECWSEWDDCADAIRALKGSR